MHRAGRTGRMGTEGKVTAFIRKENHRLFHLIQPLIQEGDKIDSILSRRGSLGMKMRRKEKEFM